VKGLSSDIESAIKIILDGLEYDLTVSELSPEKMKVVMDSKIDSFKYAKEMLHKWQNSPNAPAELKLREYIFRLVEAGDGALYVLREALREKIDYEKVDPAKVGTAIKAKPIILQAITELDSSLIELRLQLDSEKYNLADAEFTVGYAEKYARQEFFPEVNYNKQWLDEDTNSVMICPLGTKGEIIEVDGLSITLPKKPRDKSKILFSSETKKNQYWRRTPLPLGLTPDNEEAHAEYIIEEFRRRREGIWFMNNGKAVYLTGKAYFSLQWCKMKDDGSYKDFREAQLEMYYFKQACRVDKRCLGEHFTKSRRTGYTYITLDEMMESATSTCNGSYGMTSQSDKDAKKAWLKLNYMFLNLPFFFRPVVKGVVDSSKAMEFAKPSDRSKKAKKAKDTNTDDYLNTLFDYQPTTDGSYDGQKMNEYLGDEASKWKKPANYLNHWGRISPTFDEGGKIVGKAWIGSTVNPMKEGGEEFKRLHYGSLVAKRDKITGRTPTGLYAHFLPAHKNMTKFTDKYGKCWEITPPKNTYNVYGEVIKIGSIEFLEARRKAKKKIGDISYNEELRAYPMKISEALRDDASKTLFNVEKIAQQTEFNDSIVLTNHIVRGGFKWKGGVRFSTVEWFPSESGRFLTSWIPPQELRNRFTVKNGVKYPLNSHIGAFGCDSYDISGTVDGSGSKGALSGVTGFTMENAPSNTFFLEYIARPQTAEIFFEDVLMATIFYGMPMLAENNKPRLLYHFKNNGYRGYSLNRPDKYTRQLSKSERELGGVPSASEDMKISHASAIENYIENYVGVYNEEDETKQVREYGAMGNMYFQSHLDDWAHFDISNRTKYDASISSGYALMALQRHKYLKREAPKTINLGFSTYKNKGFRSEIKNY
jgi:hypothetical protein